MTNPIRLAPTASGDIIRLTLTFAATILVAVVLAGHAFATNGSTPPVADPTGFGSNVPEHVTTRPIEYDTETANGPRLRQIHCAGAGSADTRCYAAGW